MQKGWLFVFIAGFLEVLWVTGLKHAHNWWMWSGTVGAIVISFYVLLRATKILPVGTVYAVFTGIGTAGTVLIGIIFFGEPFSWAKILLILVLLGGVVGLKLITGEVEEEKGVTS